MKIAFVGDSFCGNCDQNNDWPAIVANSIGAEIIQTGIPGGHLYNAIEQFLPKMVETDYIVCCVTEPYRTFNKYGLPINVNWADFILKQDKWYLEKMDKDDYDIPPKLIKEIAKSLKVYYEYLFDYNQVKFYNIGAISLFDKMLKENNKKVIWLPCFRYSFQFVDNWSLSGHKNNIEVDQHKEQYIPVSGPSANITLSSLSIAETYDELSAMYSGKELELEAEKVLSADPRRNHFNISNNHTIANIILDIINRDSFSPDVIKLENYFTQFSLDRLDIVRK